MLSESHTDRSEVLKKVSFSPTSHTMIITSLKGKRGLLELEWDEISHDEKIKRTKPDKKES